MSSTREKLIDLLSTHETDFISGQLISDQLNISRTAVWKQMKNLEKDGYAIEAVPNKGYRIITQPTKISENTVHWGLKTEWLGKDIVHYTTLPSTQTKANQLAQEGCSHGTVVIADKQETGRGRMNRKWYSNNDAGIWLSIVLRPKVVPNQAPQFTLLVAIAIAELIEEELELTPSLKWPNDVLINHKKVAGILTEMQGEQDQINYMVVGIGLNVNHQQDMFESEIQQLASSFKIEAGKTFSKIELIQSLLQRLEQAYQDYFINGFSSVKNKWERYGYLINQEVTYTNANQKKQGIIKGIQSDGALLIETKMKQIEPIYSAEINW
ncbi:bifunctional ligase/repressor BirA [Paraliobacillus quinghaiensis]|uniref:Bifunctional ligase/repressor BirA n=1 Tax=Paraliobacillus quinghaiensis TaxID=470815 RepID=A0A917TJE1_9BACI|nr:biotin--[acetyl-CoA-carboxylase] ligase [Paraliobacillus quinghaiensis]GGM22993.1 bifunctional ligase/repressor BirA [Paraliobacillus quinghaiensis]